MRVTVTRPLTHLCPHAPERDLGTITASWDGDAVELHHLSGFLDSWAVRGETHEFVTETTAEYLAALGGKNVEVVTTWGTAGMAVTVRAEA